VTQIPNVGDVAPLRESENACSEGLAKGLVMLLQHHAQHPGGG
jgi:hypothetical protein